MADNGASEVLNETEERFFHIPLVTVLVCFEPLSVIVGSQVEQKLEELRCEVSLHRYGPPWMSQAGTPEGRSSF